MFREMGTGAYMIEHGKVVKKKYFGLKKDVFYEIKAVVYNEKIPAQTEKKKNFHSSAREYPAAGQIIKNASIQSERNTNKTRKDMDGKKYSAINANFDFLREIITAESPAEDRNTQSRINEGNDRIQKLKDLQRVISEKKNSYPNISYADKKEPDIAFYEDTRSAYTPHSGYHESAYKTNTPQPAKDTEERAPVRPAVTPLVNNGKINARDFLRRYEFSDDFIEAIRDLNISGAEEDDEFLSLIAEAAVSCFSFSGDVKIYATNPNAVFFIGPTGVGKTTTLAKIATRCSVVEDKSCVLATFDIRRIMATAQLEKYANIMKVPFRVLYYRDDLKKLLSDFIEKNIIFIDTAGTSQHDKKHIEELSEFISYMKIPREVHLCLNSSMRTRDIGKIIKNFESCRYDRIVITKSDESYSLGTALSAAARCKKPLSYITCGQGVPNDIFSAGKESLKKQLLSEWRANG